MSLPNNDLSKPNIEINLIENAVELLSQQVWCWGRDVLRPEGNWLLEQGFERVEPPADRQESPSIYSLQLPGGRWVLLRGFGVFYGDQRGSIFLPRFDFRPKYTPRSTLETQPWSVDDMPKLIDPTESQRTPCTCLTLDLIDWIRSYEVNVLKVLGQEYRQTTLMNWNNTAETHITAAGMARWWRIIGIAFAKHSELLMPTGEDEGD